MSNKVDFGPLSGLIGCWKSHNGEDVAPERNGPETNLYYEVLEFYPVRDISNAEEQNLVSLRYFQQVFRIEDNEMLHNETGYLSWDSANELLIKSFSIPRGLAVVAGGEISELEQGYEYQVAADKENSQWQITQSPFLKLKAITHSYRFNMKLENNKLSYIQSMSIDIYGKNIEHTDRNQLIKCDE
ncbi:heme-binding beta-barrel domain-containing protein [Aliikangiella sp. IMCC44653]